MSRIKLIATIITFLFVSSVCCFLNIVFPIIALTVLYFAMRNLMGITFKAQGVENFKKYKWLWISLFAVPYPICFTIGLISWPLPSTRSDLIATWQIMAVCVGYVLMVCLFGLQITQSLVKKMKAA